jgi:hypothetical protein
METTYVFVLFPFSFSVPTTARVAFASARALISASFPAWKKLWPVISPLPILSVKSLAMARGG